MVRKTIVALLSLVFTVLVGMPAQGSAVSFNPIAHDQVQVGSTITIPAHTQNVVDGIGGEGGVDKSNSSCKSSAEWIARDKLLPVNRWISATAQFHSRTTGGKLSFEFVKTTARELGPGTFLGIGNNLWEGTSAITAGAVNFCPMDTLGRELDRIYGVIGVTIAPTNQDGGGSAPSLGGLILILTIIAIISGGSRGPGGFSVKQILVKILIFIFLASSAVGASKTTESSFGTLSPGWIVSTANRAIGEVAALPASMASEFFTGDNTITHGMRGTAMNSCSQYHDQLHELYSNRAGPQGGKDPQAIMPLAMSSLWEATGLHAWRATQFGANNNYGDEVYCRLLDHFANVPVSSVLEHEDYSKSGAMQFSATRQAVISSQWGSKVADKYLKGDQSPISSAAWQPASAEMESASLIAWATCEPTGDGKWKWRNSALLMDDSADATKECNDWWTTPGADWKHNKSTFDWHQDMGDTINDAKTAEVSDFILSTRGTWGGSSGGGGFSYLISSLAVFVSFGGFAAAIFVSKIMLTFQIIMLLISLMSALLPKTDSFGQLGKWLKNVVGIATLGSFATFLFSMFSAITVTLTRSAIAFTASGSSGSMFWAAISPLVVMGVMLWGFKRAGLPNPLSVKGALAWGTGAGLVGGVAGSALANSGVGNRLMDRARGRLGSETRRASSGLVNSISGGRFGQSYRRTQKPIDKQTMSNYTSGTTDPTHLPGVTSSPGGNNDNLIGQQNPQHEESNLIAPQGSDPSAAQVGANLEQGLPLPIDVDAADNNPLLEQGAENSAPSIESSSTKIAPPTRANRELPAPQPPDIMVGPSDHKPLTPIDVNKSLDEKPDELVGQNTPKVAIDSPDKQGPMTDSRAHRLAIATERDIRLMTSTGLKSTLYKKARARQIPAGSTAAPVKPIRVSAADVIGHAVTSASNNVKAIPSKVKEAPRALGRGIAAAPQRASDRIYAKVSEGADRLRSAPVKTVAGAGGKAVKLGVKTVGVATLIASPVGAVAIPAIAAGAVAKKVVKNTAPQREAKAAARQEKKDRINQYKSAFKSGGQVPQLVNSSSQPSAQLNSGDQQPAPQTIKDANLKEGDAR